MTAGAAWPVRLVHERRGAVMLIGLFMAVLLVALLYYVIGIDQAVAQREQMQDAADAAAFSAAALHARGMNTLALANMVMAALLAILVALKLTEALAAIGIALIAVLAFLAPGLAGWIPGLDQIRRDVRAAHDSLEPTIHAALRTLHTLEHGIRVLVPAAAQLRALEIVRGHHHPPAEFAFVLPSTRMTLPTEDGEFGQVCDHATGYVGDLVSLTLSPLTPSPIADLVGDATADLAAAGSPWFCGGAAKPPRTSLAVKAQLPVLAARKACADYDAGADYDAARHEALCAQAEADEQASEPDPDTGACVRECDRDSPYAERAALAREQCRPAASRALSRFVWAQREVEYTYVFHRGAWRVAHSAIVAGSQRLVRATQPPCGSPSAAGGPEWTMPRLGPHGGALQALCSNEAPPQHERNAFEGARVGPLRFTEFVDVFGCVEKKHVRQQVAPDAGRAGSSSDESPQRMASDAQLGEEPFQLRAVVVGTMREAAQPRIEPASWGNAVAPSALAFSAAARAAAHIAYAQAEFFYAVEDRTADERAGYLWNMRWQARLRRFRMPEPREGPATASTSASTLDADDAARFGADALATDAQQACEQARRRSSDGLVAAQAPDCPASDRALSDAALRSIH